MSLRRFSLLPLIFRFLFAIRRHFAAFAFAAIVYFSLISSFAIFATLSSTPPLLITPLMSDAA
jgi:hypothetical protein